MKYAFLIVAAFLLRAPSSAQHVIPVFGPCAAGTIEEMEQCSMNNLISHLNRKMKLLKDDYGSLGLENKLPIVIRMSISADGEYTYLKVYDTQWKLDLTWLTRDAGKKWSTGSRGHDFTLVACYHFSRKHTFSIDAPDNEAFILDALGRAQAEDDFILGTELMNKGDYASAIPRLTSHLKYYSNNSNAIYNLALCHDRTGDSLKACLYWNYLGRQGDAECRTLVRDYCRFDFSSPEALRDVEVELLQVVTEMPQYPGGAEAMEHFLQQAVSMPDAARKKKISGRVLVTCTIDKTGKVKDARVSGPLGYGCDEEALKAVNAMPVWVPGKVKGSLSDIEITIPVYFNL